MNVTWMNLLTETNHQLLRIHAGSVPEGLLIAGGTEAESQRESGDRESEGQGKIECQRNSYRRQLRFSLMHLLSPAVFGSVHSSLVSVVLLTHR